jgi:hypothetical protein
MMMSTRLALKSSTDRTGLVGRSLSMRRHWSPRARITKPATWLVR